MGRCICRRHGAGRRAGGSGRGRAATGKRIYPDAFYVLTTAAEVLGVISWSVILLHTACAGAQGHQSIYYVEAGLALIQPQVEVVRRREVVCAPFYRKDAVGSSTLCRRVYAAWVG